MLESCENCKCFEQGDIDEKGNCTFFDEETTCNMSCGAWDEK